MQYQTKLKDNAWIDIPVFADWLNLKSSKVDVSSVKASETIQNLTYTAILGGVEGNLISIEYTAGGTAGAEVVSVINNAISVQIDDGVSNSLQIKTAIDAFSAAAALVSVSEVAVTAVQNIVVATLLLGGTDPSADDSKLVRRLELFINMACDKIETIIDTTVLPRQFQEDQDGNNSNTVVPSHWPVQSITEIRIDFNRKFTDPTIIDPSNYFLRGTADRRQRITDTEVRIIGSNIVLRDDNEKFIVGRVFAGSALGSIRIKYTAGWTKEWTRVLNETTGLIEIESQDLPQDLTLAALQLAEFWYYQRENRDIGYISKGVQGESYTKKENGIPAQIYQLLEQYVDESFGPENLPQRNTWGLSGGN